MRLLLLSLLLAAASVHAQRTGTVVGTVRDAHTGETLPGASVRIEGTTLGAATDTDGRFTVLDVPAGDHAVLVSFIGYERLTFPRLPVIAGETLRLDAALTVGGMERLTVGGREMLEVCVCCAHCGYLPVMSREPVASRTLGHGEIECLPVGR